MEDTAVENQLSERSTPWGKPSPPVLCSLEEVMSEELARTLQDKENTLAGVHEPVQGQEVDQEVMELIAALTPDTIGAAGSSGETASDVADTASDVADTASDVADTASDVAETASDVALAQTLQMQYDKEHNDFLTAKEAKFNGSSKVSISYENYKFQHPAFRDEEEPAGDDDDDERTNWDDEPPDFKQGISGKGKNMTTKHDAVICGRKNASRLMEFPPEFESGDGEGMDLQLPNRVYNALKRHSEAESKRSTRLHEKKEHSTAEHAMDPRTRLLLFKLVNDGTLESVSGSISTGKESVVFHAHGGPGKDEKVIPSEIAIKVFKTTLNEFKTREKYVHGDHRFSKDDYKKHNPRKIIKMWAMKEAANLNRMKKFQVPCPEVILQRKHLLLMTFIGDNQIPAPKLKDTSLSTEDLQDAYNQTIAIMKTLYRECALVHADLSEFNLLWYRDKVYVIDVSCAVDLTHPAAMEFLHRDCKNISSFFTKGGVHKVLSAERMFNKITKQNIKGQGADFVAQVQRCNKEKRQELLASDSSLVEYPFDYFWDRSISDRELQAVSDSDSGDED